MTCESVHVSVFAGRDKAGSTDSGEKENKTLHKLFGQFNLHAESDGTVASSDDQHHEHAQERQGRGLEKNFIQAVLRKGEESGSGVIRPLMGLEEVVRNVWEKKVNTGGTAAGEVGGV